MGAPEKIYVTPVRTWDTKHIPDLSDNIYISKDALLEWLKENLQEACDEEGVPFEYYENGIITGKISAFEQVIDKLNSM